MDGWQLVAAPISSQLLNEVININVVKLFLHSTVWKMYLLSEFNGAGENVTSCCYWCWIRQD